MNRISSTVPEGNGIQTGQAVVHIAGSAAIASPPRQSAYPLTAGGKVYAADRWLVRRTLRRLGDPPLGVVVRVHWCVAVVGSRLHG